MRSLTLGLLLQDLRDHRALRGADHPSLFGHQARLVPRDARQTAAQQVAVLAFDGREDRQFMFRRIHRIPTTTDPYFQHGPVHVLFGKPEKGQRGV
ncbi:MAG: hypothetical protein OXF22_04390 [Anaerolineaceae bacterium]|nr:hypothetical protein [Anaerolineaceae bacterium]